jgi:hypothetical protein
MANGSASGSRASPLVKASIRRLDAGLGQLEALHKSSGTGSHLRIPDGKRIKLFHEYPGDSVQPARTRKKSSKFGVGVSALKEDDGVTSGTSPIELSDSDEFPEPRELVRASIRSAGEANGSMVSPDSDYSDPDMDAVIRSAHLDGITSTGTARTRATACIGTVSPGLRTQVRTDRSYN